jgi:hypothetical protein
MKRFLLSCSLVLFASSAFAEGGMYKTQDELATAYRQFHEKQNCDGVMSLVYKDGVSPEMLDMVKAQMCGVLSKTIADITFESVDPARTQPITRDGKTYSPTLPPIGKMKISFVKTGEQAQITANSYMFGQKDSAFYIVTSKVEAAK